MNWLWFLYRGHQVMRDADKSWHWTPPSHHVTFFSKFGPFLKASEISINAGSSISSFAKNSDSDCENCILAEIRSISIHTFSHRLALDL